MPKLTPEQENALTAYKTGQRDLHGQTINNLLRAEQACPEVDILEGMMTRGNTPNVLYRALENANVRVEDGIICDRAFLSTSSDMSYIEQFMPQPNAAILVIRNCAEIPSIDVVGILGHQNYESEFILPRNLRLRVKGIHQYEPGNYREFVHDYPQIGYNERAFYDINAITVYEVEPI